MNCKSLLVFALLCLVVVSCSGGENGDDKNVAKPEVSVSPLQSAQDSATPGAGGDGAGNCLPLLEKYCVSCHNVARVCQKIGKKSAARWKRTIKRMVKRGATLPSEKTSYLVDCLVQQSDDITTACQ